MKIRDRVTELRRVRAGDLLPNPRNWRTHPQAQREALEGLLTEIGYAGALLARQTPAGLMLIDGHLRAETTPEQEVPVLVLDVTEDEANKLLATLDPLGAMAAADSEKLDALLREVNTGSQAMAAMLEELAEASGLLDDDTAADEEEPGSEARVGHDEARMAQGAAASDAERWGVYITCDSEAQQKALLERFNGEGLTVRGVMA